MQQSDFTRFHEVLIGMAELYQRELSTPLLDVYWLALKDWSLAEFQEAAAHLMSTATFMPRPADFNQLRKINTIAVGNAWDEVMRFCRQSLRGNTPGGAIDAAVKAIGGYRAIADSDVEKHMPYLQKRFVDAYKEALEREEKVGALPLLASRQVDHEGQAKLASLINSSVAPMIEQKPVIPQQK